MIVKFSRFVIINILLNLYFCRGYKILAVFPLASKSHGILGDSMVKHLIDAGHEVTYVTPFVKKEVHPKLKIINLSENIKLFNENTVNIKQIMDKEVDFQDTDRMTGLFIDVASKTLEASSIQELMQNRDQKFDIVLGEWMFSELYCVFAAIFECPMIWLSTMEPHWIILNLIDGPTNPAYTNSYHADYVTPLSFINRVHELWTQIIGLLRKNLKFYNKEDEVYQRLIVPILKQNSRAVPSYETLKYNASLVLGNSHVVLGDAIALPQNYKHIGGYHIDEKLQPLPENLQGILDTAKHGVIYFSMGSNVKSKDMPVELKRGILNVFEDLNQTVVWKIEEMLTDLPKNVHIVQWAPQQSILAHPNLVLFITHGGSLSMIEAVHFGIPVIVIPVFADQFANALRVAKKGFGKRLELTHTMYKDLKIGIKEVLNDPKYSKRAKEISLAYHDGLMKPKEELLFWVDHVVRTHGAPHLHSPALHLPLYQRLCLDIIVVILVLVYIIKITARCIFSKFKGNVFFEKEKCS